MLRLARILKEMHERGYAHRDIKPENLLVLDGKIYLSDFGLVWTADRPERLTGAGERIGPALILPPELEQADIDADIEYYPSDVYLFAKVVWMVIKSDSWGFRGQYNRKMRQIYLRKEQYAVYTLEPVHRLLEQATYDEIEKRITIQECIDYLQQQIEILEKDKENRLDEHTWHALRYAESSQEFLNQNKPEEAVYIDKIKIYQYLQKILQDSKVYIVNTSGVKKEIKVTSVTIRADQCATLDAYYYGKRVKEYLFCAEKLICREENNTTCAKVELREVEDYDESYVDFEKASTGFGNVNPKIVLSDAYWLELAAKGCL
jgi:serine/threonine protein kinase